MSIAKQKSESKQISGSKNDLPDRRGLLNDDLHREELPPAKLGRLSRSERKRRRREISQTYWAREQDDVSEVPQSVRMQAIQAYGDFSLAYSIAVQPRLQHFGDEENLVAYRKRWGVTYALGDPVCSKKNLKSFLGAVVSELNSPSFCQISKPTAESLSKLGYLINEMGVDTRIDLPNYSFKGKSKEWLRYAANWTNRRGYQVIEATFSDINVAEVEAISEEWRKTRTVKRKEVRFLNRPIVMEDEPNVRKFFLRDEAGKICAFVFLDPLFEAGEVVGYVTSIKRRLPDSPIYAEQAIMKAIIETLQSECVNTLKLGLSPGAWIDSTEFSESRFRRWVFERAFSSRWMNRYAYNMIGHANYKRRFKGIEEKVYLATPRQFHPIRIPALIALCGIA